jgi:hypothetical protein
MGKFEIWHARSKRMVACPACGNHNKLKEPVEPLTEDRARELALKEVNSWSILDENNSSQLVAV